MNRQRYKRVLALLLTFALVFTMHSPAFATSELPAAESTVTEGTPEETPAPADADPENTGEAAPENPDEGGEEPGAGESAPGIETPAEEPGAEAPETVTDPQPEESVSEDGLPEEELVSEDELPEEELVSEDELPAEALSGDELPEEESPEEEVSAEFRGGGEVWTQESVKYKASIKGNALEVYRRVSNNACEYLLSGNIPKENGIIVFENGGEGVNYSEKELSGNQCIQNIVLSSNVTISSATVILSADCGLSEKATIQRLSENGAEITISSPTLKQ
nr:hypothetical protein [Lachnospiraceae bacterium]